MIYLSKWDNLFANNPEKLEIAHEIWGEVLAECTGEQIKKGLDMCLKTHEWPPGATQFKNLCLDDPLTPNERVALRRASEKDFGHPVTLLAYQKVGQWDMEHDSQDVLVKKWAVAYKEAVEDHRKGVRPRPLKPLHPEIKQVIHHVCETFGLTFHDRLVRVREENEALQIEHPKWDREKYEFSMATFDQAYADERKRYLVKLSEVEALNLGRDDAYDRRRFMGE